MRMHKLIFICSFVSLSLITGVRSEPEYDRSHHEIRKRLSGDFCSPLGRREGISKDLKENLDLIGGHVKPGHEESFLREKLGGKSIKVELKLQRTGLLLDCHIVQSSGSSKLDHAMLHLVRGSGPFLEIASSEDQSFIAEFPTFRVSELGE
jgi:hypothetical protein